MPPKKAAKKVVETPRAKPFAKYLDPVSGKTDMNWSTPHDGLDRREKREKCLIPEGAISATTPWFLA